MRNLQGKAVTKRCLIIPVDDCEGVFLGEKGCYLNMTAIAMQEPKFKDTHCIKVNIPQEQRKAMTEEERNAQHLSSEGFTLSRLNRRQCR